MSEDRSGSDHWEQRYREALESLETQGREVRQLEHRLRRAVAHVAMAGLGGDTHLNRYLETVREASNTDAPVSDIHRAVDDMVVYLRRQAEREIRLPSRDGGPQSLLRRLLLQSLAVLAARHPEDDALVRARDRVSQGDIQELARAVELVESRLLAEGQENDSGQRAGWRTLFGGGRSRNGSTPVALTGLVNRLADQLDPDTLAPLRKQLETDGERAVLPVCQALAEAVETALADARADTSPSDGGTTPPAESPAPKSTESVPEDDRAESGSDRRGARRRLKAGQKAVTAIKVPKSLKNEAEQLLERAGQQLADVDSIGDWLDDLAGLLARYRVSVEQERESLKQFLETVLGRLSELEKYFSSERANRERRAASGKKLDSALDEELAEIRQTVGRTQELGRLGKAITERLGRIDRQLGRRRKLERKADTDAEQRLQAMETRMRQMEAEANGLRKRLRHARASSATDELTNLPNRRGHEQRLKYEFARFERHGRPLCLAVCDIDDFKTINDELGHAGGDTALVQFAEEMRKVRRQIDHLARVGGEEFVVILPETTLAEAEKWAERLRRHIEVTGFEYEDVTYSLTLSIGLTTFSEDDSPESVFRRADAALYSAKEQGRNRVVLAERSQSE